MRCRKPRPPRRRSQRRPRPLFLRVTVIGASGFVGRHLVATLGSRGDDVVTASLRDTMAAVQACDGAAAVVNLAGEPVAQRWTPDTKRRILSSRVDSPRLLIDGLATLTDRPKAYISASAIGYYGTDGDDAFVETSPPGSDFLAEVCVAWEAEARRAADLGMRVALVRTGLALGTGGGALAKLLPIFRIGLGGPIAGGRQWYSWIHIDDLVSLYLLAIDAGDGPYNATAPQPVRNAEFTRALARALNRPAVFPVPAAAIRLVLGEAATTVVEGQRVLPERTLASGFRFSYSNIAAAFENLFPTQRRSE